jgi:hypothetical protein
MSLTGRGVSDMGSVQFQEYAKKGNSCLLKREADGRQEMKEGMQT